VIWSRIRSNRHHLADPDRHPGPADPETDPDLYQKISTYGKIAKNYNFHEKDNTMSIGINLIKKRKSDFVKLVKLCV
jgi:hypothetical protein